MSTIPNPSSVGSVDGKQEELAAVIVIQKLIGKNETYEPHFLPEAHEVR